MNIQTLLQPKPWDKLITINFSLLNNYIVNFNDDITHIVKSIHNDDSGGIHCICNYQFKNDNIVQADVVVVANNFEINSTHGIVTGGTLTIVDDLENINKARHVILHKCREALLENNRRLKQCQRRQKHMIQHINKLIGENDG